jgi:hypothetical protein
MDNTTKALRARLLAAYRRLRADIGGPEPSPTGYFRWLSSQVERDAGNQTRTGWIGDQQLEVVVGDSLAGREGKAEAFARVFLGAIASDAEVGFLSRCLEIRQALAKNPAGETEEHERWTMTRPNGTSFSPEPMRASAMLCYVAEVLDEWIEHLADDAPSTDGLIPEARLFLKAMLDLGLHDGKRGKQDDVWERIAAIDKERQGKKDRTAALKLLKDRKLVDSLSGTGTTLTDAGLKLARSLK